MDTTIIIHFMISCLDFLLSNFHFLPLMFTLLYETSPSNDDPLTPNPDILSMLLSRLASSNLILSLSSSTVVGLGLKTFSFRMPQIQKSRGFMSGDLAPANQAHWWCSRPASCCRTACPSTTWSWPRSSSAQGWTAALPYYCVWNNKTNINKDNTVYSSCTAGTLCIYA